MPTGIFKRQSGMMGKAPIMKPCEACGALFKVYHSARVRRRFCSHACKAASDRAEHLQNFTCPQCGKIETLPRYVAARKRFCSAKCWHAASGFKVTGYRTKRGYVRRGDKSEHRIVMEEKLGRALMAGEIVHHIDGRRDNNDPANLELWTRKDPPGQRVVDQIHWAAAIFRMYPEIARELGYEPPREHIDLFPILASIMQSKYTDAHDDICRSEILLKDQ